MAFGSVSMMLQATYGALFSSFRAVLGVADHFGRMRHSFGQIFATMSMIRQLRLLLARVLGMVGITPPPSLIPPPIEAPALEDGEVDQQDRPKSWPVLLFFAVAIGGPYLIYNLLKDSGNSKAKNDARQPVKARALWDFASENPQELSFRANEMLTVFPPTMPNQYPQGWVMAGRTGNNNNGIIGNQGNQRGLVPANYVRLQKPEGAEAGAGGLPQAEAGTAVEVAGMETAFGGGGLRQPAQSQAQAQQFQQFQQFQQQQQQQQGGPESGLEASFAASNRGASASPPPTAAAAAAAAAAVTTVTTAAPVAAAAPDPNGFPGMTGFGGNGGSPRSWEAGFGGNASEPAPTPVVVYDTVGPPSKPWENLVCAAAAPASVSSAAGPSAALPGLRPWEMPPNGAGGGGLPAGAQIEAIGDGRPDVVP